MKRLSIIILFILGVLPIITINLQAQLSLPLDSYYHDVRIGLVDEFFARFNGVQSHPRIPEGSDNSRLANLMMLFDQSQFASKEDPVYIEALSMMDKVQKDSILLHYADTTWTALAHCKGTLDRDSVAFDLYLTVEHRRDDMYKWVISGVDGDVFSVNPRNMADGIMLAPDDHETNFISLGRMSTEQPYNVMRFLRRSFGYDAMSAFTYLIHSGRLSIDYVDNLEFIFTQIPGYVFTLRYFIRESDNSGWLIADFHAASQQEKDKLMEKLYGPNINKTDMAFSVIDENVTNGIILNHQMAVNVDSLKAVFQRRTNEKIVQLRDYMSFLQQKKIPKTAKLYYEGLMKSLFASDVVVITVDAHNGTTKHYDIDQLVSILEKKRKLQVNIAAIEIPAWNDSIAFMPEGVGHVNLSVARKAFHTDVVIPSSIGERMVLPAYREETEDGVEWIPLFGDMIITIR